MASTHSWSARQVTRSGQAKGAVAMRTYTAGKFLFALTALCIASIMMGCNPQVQALTKDLKNPDSQVRWNAAEGLGKVKDTATIKPLIAALNDEAPEVAWAVADSLGKQGKPAVKPLVAQLGNKSAEVRQLAAFSLGLIADPEASASLAKTLKTDKAADVRGEAATSLGAIGDQTAKNALQGASKERDPSVKKAVSAALGVIAGKEAIEKKKLAEIARKKKIDEDRKRKAREKAAKEKKLEDARKRKAAADKTRNERLAAERKRKAAEDAEKKAEEVRKKNFKAQREKRMKRRAPKAPAK